jgi:ElaB/YqjD/DUF883 family membrane-anchored ribosome-binding protein
VTNPIGDKIKQARETAATASEQLREVGVIARENAAVAYDSSREAAEALKERSVKAIQDNPLAVVAGGLAVGMLLGALWPKTAKRGRATSTLAASLLAARGASLTASGELAKASGKIREKIGEIDTDTARAKLNELVQVDRAREKISDLLEKATEAVSAAGKNAAESLRRKD